MYQTFNQGPLRIYQVHYQLKQALLNQGRVIGVYRVTSSRCFPTDEITVILADLYSEVGPSATLLGLEILRIRRVKSPRTGQFLTAAAR